MTPAPPFPTLHLGCGPSGRLAGGDARLHGLLVPGIAAGGALGALSRYGVGRLLAPVSGAFPWGTLAVNVVGCVLLLVAGALLQGAAVLGPAATIGFVGAFTTFSTFQVETVTLADVSPLRAALYLFGSAAAGLLAAALGARLGALWH